MKHVFKVQLTFPRVVLSSREGSIDERARAMITDLLEYELLKEQRYETDYLIRDEHDSQFLIDIVLTFKVNIDTHFRIRESAKTLVPDEVERLLSQNGLNHVSHEIIIYDTWYKK